MMKCKYCGLQIHDTRFSEYYGNSYEHVGTPRFRTCVYATHSHVTDDKDKWYGTDEKPFVATPMDNGQTEPLVPTPMAKPFASKSLPTNVVPFKKPRAKRVKKIVLPEVVGRKFRRAPNA